MDELTGIFVRATQGVKEIYFRLPIDGGTPKYRERVYCYELYHQMRCLWPEDTDFVLNGEVYKGGHPLLKRLELSRFSPDLLVHKPGSMQGNFAIIEVKRQSPDERGVKKDLDSLSRFVTRGQYKRAIYLIFGDGAESALQRVRELAGENDTLQSIELWIHDQPGSPARFVGTVGQSGSTT